MLQGFLVLFRFFAFAKTPATPDTFELPGFPLVQLEDRMTEHGRHRAAGRAVLPRPTNRTPLIATVMALVVGAAVLVAHPIQAEAVQPYIDVKALYQSDDTVLAYRDIAFSSSQVTDTQELDFGQEVTEDPQIALGTEIVMKAGVTGSQTVTYNVRYLDGVEVSREVLSKTIDAQPVDEIVRKGTGDSKDVKVALQTVAAGVGTPQGNKDYAEVYIQQTFGWDATQFVCLTKLWTRESNWRTAAHNRSSGAHGIAQALPGRKMATVASDWKTNPITQIKWGAGYIKGRYHTPCNAWSHSEKVGWY